MILYRKMKEKDLKAVGQFLEEEALSISAYLKDCHHATLVEKEEAIIGFSTYHLVDEQTALLTCLVIKTNQRGQQYGDGLLKTTLNQADHDQVKHMYVEAKDLGGFFEHVGFTPVDLGQTYPLLAKATHRTKLPDFFETACRSKR